MKNNFWMLIASVLGGVGLYLFRIVLARVLSPTEYGHYSTVAALLMIMGFFVGSIGYTSTKIYDDVGISSLTVSALLLGGSFAFSLVVLHPWLIDYFELTVLVFLVPVLMKMLVMTYYQPILGFHQKQKNFRKIGISEILEAIFLIITATIIFFVGRVKLLYAVVLLPVSQLVSTIAIVPGSPVPGRGFSLDEIKRTLSDIPNSIGVNSLLMIPTSVDMLVVSAKFSGAVVGFWGVLTVFGKAYVVVTRAISRVMFANLGAGNHRPLRFPLILASLLAIVGTTIGVLFPEFWITWLFGEQYTELAWLMPLYMVMMLPLPAIALVGIYLFGIDEFRKGLLLFGVLSVPYLLIPLASSLHDVVEILLVGHYAIFIGLWLYYYVMWK